MKLDSPKVLSSTQAGQWFGVFCLVRLRRGRGGFQGFGGDALAEERIAARHQTGGFFVFFFGFFFFFFGRFFPH